LKEVIYSLYTTQKHSTNVTMLYIISITSGKTIKNSRTSTQMVCTITSQLFLNSMLRQSTFLNCKHGVNCSDYVKTCTLYRIHTHFTHNNCL